MTIFVIRVGYLVLFMSSKGKAVPLRPRQAQRVPWS